MDEVSSLPVGLEIQTKLAPDLGVAVGALIHKLEDVLGHWRHESTCVFGAIDSAGVVESAAVNGIHVVRHLEGWESGSSVMRLRCNKGQGEGMTQGARQILGMMRTCERYGCNKDKART